ncbi:2-hydroxyacyl-CoA dehydratase [Desulfovibrio sp. OttesenSCG-928-I05]|nr:2-hydroxyacyl-CoA dehydratase [Desulfovibrio sp. OttesenSCG-928-I05]
MTDMTIYVGLDIGSTTVKGVILDTEGKLLFSRYQRHYSEVRATLAALLAEMLEQFPEREWHVAVTGSGAISLAEELGIAFVQEVIAASLAIRSRIPHADVAIELGGEDAKITFFTGGVERRMNETCAGGTGAFIDQMASFLNTDAAGLNELATRHETLYPIASRCGVFAKTDVLPLLNEGCAREDIAASIMQAVVDQTISGLAWGRSIKGTVVFLGGPLAFLSSLRERFTHTLNLGPGNAVFPENAEYFVALGAAEYAKNAATGSSPSDGINEETLRTLLVRLKAAAAKGETTHMPPLFENAEQLEEFKKRHNGEKAGTFPLEQHSGDAWLGIDSGSTTLKAVLIDEQGRILYSFYSSHSGDPLPAAVSVLGEIYKKKNDATHIRATTVTGYGSGLLKAALGADIDEVETVAHYTGARFFEPNVSYILDIGGQDIKCLRIRGNAVDRIQLNEACSAGCGSFIETFAKSLGMPLSQFVEAALDAREPVDLGTRCTVFMNSKVKQAQKDGAGVGDIAAGLSYSVIRNACYKVMKIADPEELGSHVVAQGGSFMNDALLRALELTLGKEVVRPNIAGLMGAFGAALIAKERGPAAETSALLDQEALANFSVSARTTRCTRCSNHCLLTISRFADGSRFISGNRCEEGLGKGKSTESLPNLYKYKYQRLFEPYEPLSKEQAKRGVIGIPRTLNIFENYPLWFTIFTSLGFRVELSSPSSKEIFQLGYNTIPSQTVCYPAKLAHGHIYDLLARDVDAIFFPCLPFEAQEFKTQTNHYNCPVVIGYPELLANNVPELRTRDIPYIHSFLPLEKSALPRRLRDIPFFSGISLSELEAAVRKGFEEQERCKSDICRAGEKALEELHAKGAFGIILAGHPYHVDPEIHHGISDLIISCGMGVLTEDSVAHLMPDPGPLRVVDQWTYHARLYRAGAYAAGTDNLAVLQLVSFGCGLDAITSDEVEEIMMVKGKLYAQIKIDEGSNLGPARIRIRSLLAALRDRKLRTDTPPPVPVFTGSPPFTDAMRETHTILVPQLSPIHFQFIETIFTSAGYKAVQLPEVSREALETGLRYVHNDACFPAIVVVGQLLHAVRSGEFDTNKIALMISQTGGGCRATNYIAFLRKALVSCGLDHIPIISFNVGGMDKNPGFRLSGEILRRVLMAGYYGDAIMRMVHRVRPYEAEPGSTQRLTDYWVGKLKHVLREGKPLGFHIDMFSMVKDFDNLPLVTEERKPRCGLVGEILLKYHPDANNRAAEIIEAEGGEAVVTDLMDFVLYSFYDDVFRYRHLSGSWKNYLIGISSIAFIEYCRWSMRWALSRSKRFTAPLSFGKLRQKAKSLISLGHQTGEGWLLAAEMVEMLETDCDNILCMQPFGCLPNHITGKGLLNELKRRYPKANIAAVDYDPGASEVNQINRIKLMMSCIRE